MVLFNLRHVHKVHISSKTTDYNQSLPEQCLHTISNATTNTCLMFLKAETSSSLQYSHIMKMEFPVTLFPILFLVSLKPTNNCRTDSYGRTSNNLYKYSDYIKWEQFINCIYQKYFYLIKNSTTYLINFMLRVL